MKEPNTWKSHLVKYEPRRNEPCLCGSGIKFKRCCLEAYSSQDRKRVFEYYNKGLYDKALIACRHHLTWYILCHRAHTIPFLASNTKASEKMLQVDIEALADTVDLLRYCYHQAGQSDNFPLVLSQLEGAVDDPRWTEKVIYLRSLWWLADKGDRNASLRIISEVKIASCNDPEILTLYLDVCHHNLGFKQRIEIIDRIITNTNKEPYKLQYSVLKGITYCLINDIEEGCQIIQGGIDNYRALDAKKKTRYADFQFAHALHNLGDFTENNSLLRDALEHLEILFDRADKSTYNSEYFADLAKSLGDCMASLQKHSEAIEYYRTSLRYSDSELTKAFLARSYVNSSDQDSARKLLLSIDATLLDENAYLDYAFSWASLATCFLNKEDINSSIQYIRQAEPSWPLFQQRKDSILIQLLELSHSTPESKRKGIIGTLNRYLSLNLNFFGLGINFNKIIEDLRGNTQD